MLLVFIIKMTIKKKLSELLKIAKINYETTIQGEIEHISILVDVDCKMIYE